MSGTAAGCNSRAFWPIGEAAQADYETLRGQVLAFGALPRSLPAARFACRGLAGLIAWPAAEPCFSAGLIGATRPRWSPHTDPRCDALAAGFAVLLAAEDARAEPAQEGWPR